MKVGRATAWRNATADGAGRGGVARVSGGGRLVLLASECMPRAQDARVARLSPPSRVATRRATLATNRQRTSSGAARTDAEDAARHPRHPAPHFAGYFFFGL